MCCSRPQSIKWNQYSFKMFTTLTPAAKIVLPESDKAFFCFRRKSFSTHTIECFFERTLCSRILPFYANLYMENIDGSLWESIDRSLLRNTDICLLRNIDRSLWKSIDISLWKSIVLSLWKSIYRSLLNIIDRSLWISINISLWKTICRSL